LPIIHHRLHVTATSHVLHCTEFNQSDVVNIQNVQYRIRSKNYALNFIAVRYSLQKFGETILCLK